MSNYRAEALNPKTCRVENADWMDNHFGNHIYGVKFDDGEVYHTWEVGLLAAGKRLEALTRVLKVSLQFIDPDQSPPRMTNRELVREIKVSLAAVGASRD